MAKFRLTYKRSEEALEYSVILSIPSIAPSHPPEVVMDYIRSGKLGPDYAWLRSSEITVTRLDQLDDQEH